MLNSEYWSTYKNVTSEKKKTVVKVDSKVDFQRTEYLKWFHNRLQSCMKQHINKQKSQR